VRQIAIDGTLVGAVIQAHGRAAEASPLISGKLVAAPAVLMGT
jgi:hypothetical protein